MKYLTLLLLISGCVIRKNEVAMPAKIYQSTKKDYGNWQELPSESRSNSNKLNIISANIAKALQKNKFNKIAIISENCEVSKLSKLLIAKGILIVERENIKRIMTEQKFQELFINNNITKNLSGIDALLFYSNNLNLSLKIVDVKTGTIIYSE